MLKLIYVHVSCLFLHFLIETVTKRYQLHKEIYKRTTFREKCEEQEAREQNKWSYCESLFGPFVCITFWCNFLFSGGNILPNP